jgi:STE24 endopeptidase
LQTEAATLARAEGVPGVRLLVQDVQRRTTAPNAEAVGFGSTRGVIVWDTLLDGRFDRAEVRAVLAHEFGHLAHEDPLKAVGWLVLLLAPATWLIALLTRGRGGMAQPEAVPLGLLILVLVNLLALPLHNAVSRRIEADADWTSLETTHDPMATRALFQKLARTSDANPDPPTWSYLLDADHPTIMQRLRMVEAFARLHNAKPSL